MSSSDRRFVLGLLLALPLAACGFAPAYGPGSAARALLGKIDVAPPHDKTSFDLVSELEQRLGRADNPAYLLTYSIGLSSGALEITQSNAITRYDLIGTVDYRLIAKADKKVVASGRVKNFTSFSAAGTIVETNATERDTYSRLMRMLADQLSTELVAKVSAWAAEPHGPTPPAGTPARTGG